MRDLLEIKPEVDPYTALKNALLTRLTKSESEQVRTLFDDETMGDRTPSQFLRQLESLVSPTDRVAPMFRWVFIRKMPASIQSHLAAQTSLDLPKLAEAADQLLTFQRSSPSAPVAAIASATPALSEDSIQAIAAALHGRFQRQAQSRPVQPSGTASSANSGICRYHRKFGDQARNCKPPCSWVPKNGPAGSRQ